MMISYNLHKMEWAPVGGTCLITVTRFYKQKKTNARAVGNWFTASRTSLM